MKLNASIMAVLLYDDVKQHAVLLKDSYLVRIHQYYNGFRISLTGSHFPYTRKMVE